ncbi:MAG: methyltransferase domain-containing protein [Magnetococcales bacterium]|nr:methyltransferase domain-containing protein [Magnetococcales bacterium]
MTFDAIRLQSWYGTEQGETVVRLAGGVMERWVSAIPANQSCGLGYAQPYLNHLSRYLGNCVGASPAEMGVSSWPLGKNNRIAQIRPNALPFPDKQFNRVIITHLLEGTVESQGVIREVWRILEPGGRLLLMVPNRGGLWARRDSTPFGWGQPFSPAQLRVVLQDSLFVVRQSCFALFKPPVKDRRWLGSASSWEKAGNRWFAPLGGVILCEAEKLVYAKSPLRSNIEMVRQPAVEAIKMDSACTETSINQANDTADATESDLNLVTRNSQQEKK